MELSLEIEEGHQYNKLITEIEHKYKDYLNKANKSFQNKDYEKTILYYQLCLSLDPDNTHHIRINQSLKYLVNELLKCYIDCSYHSFIKTNYNISKYYITKSLSLMIIFNDKIKKNLKEFYEILNKRLNYINDLNISSYDIQKKNLYNINIKN